MKSLISRRVSLCLFALLALLLIPSIRAQAQTLKILYSFGNWPDGTAPDAGLVSDKLGNLYGACQDGGDTHWGALFKVDTSGNETVLHSFGQPLTNGTSDGAAPLARLVMDKAGNLYGTTIFGGDTGGEDGNGIAFKLDTAGNYTVLHIFGSFPDDGRNPQAGLIMDRKGNLYGVTQTGGSFNFGTVFELDVAGTETILHSFTGSDGSYPAGDLLMDKKGDLYGTTSAGGAFNRGTVFRLDTSRNETVLHSFTGPDGAAPFAGLIMDKKGNLYGSTANGGSADSGTLFKLDTAGHETVLHNFMGMPDGALPTGGLLMDKAGNLYGTTVLGGSFGGGTIFKLDNSGHETLLHNFADTPDGISPFGGVIMDRAGNLYGTTQNGGDFGHGTVFELVP